MHQVHTCMCKVGPDDDAGCGPQCMNRLMYMECYPGACPCGSKCGNRRFQLRQTVAVQTTRFHTPGKGQSTTSPSLRVYVTVWEMECAIKSTTQLKSTRNVPSPCLCGRVFNFGCLNYRCSHSYLVSEGLFIQLKQCVD